MKSTQPNRMTIVARIDTLSSSYEALDEALSLASLMPSVDLYIAAIPSGGTGPLTSQSRQQRSEAAQRRIVAALSERMKSGKIHEGIQFSLDVLEGDPSEQLSNLAQKVDADMLVMTAGDDKGLREMLFGSLQRQLIKRRICPVLLVPEDGHRAVAAIEAARPGEEPKSGIKAPTRDVSVPRNVAASENLPLALEMER